jgi:hypothetical protein
MDQLSELREGSQLADRCWRLNNLYTIQTKEGMKVPFRLNWAQSELLSNIHECNLILKARQLGFTTFIQLFMLDACLFNSNVRAGTIAHRLDDARVIFRDKVKAPYLDLPETLQKAVPIVRDSADELTFGNNSSIRVSTSMRSGTLQYLHISEYGQLCAKFPDKAREIRTGALNTVQAGQVVFIESTAEGKEGHFYDLCTQGQAKQRMGVPLTPLDFRFSFFPWWKAPEYTIDPEGVVIEEQFRKYFDTLKETQEIDLTPAQQAWYCKKAETQLADMRREYPSTPDEAFEASVEGAYYSELLAAAELQGRIGEFPAIEGVPVDVSWDIGVGDATSLWFSQRLGEKTRLVGYFEASGEGLRFYVDQANRMARERGWKIGDALWPHDGRVREWGSGKSRMEQFREYTGRMPRIVPQLSLDDGIAAVRTVLPHCEFDAAGCAEGLKALRAYRKEWDDERGCWRDRPRHDWASHGADAFRVLASRYRQPTPAPAPRPKRDRVVLVADKYGQVHYEDGCGVVPMQDVVKAYCFKKDAERRRDGS